MDYNANDLLYTTGNTDLAPFTSVSTERTTLNDESVSFVQSTSASASQLTTEDNLVIETSSTSKPTTLNNDSKNSIVISDSMIKTITENIQSSYSTTENSNLSVIAESTAQSVLCKTNTIPILMHHMHIYMIQRQIEYYQSQIHRFK
jgi:hypothetical protein